VSFKKSFVIQFLLFWIIYPFLNPHILLFLTTSRDEKRDCFIFFLDFEDGFYPSSEVY